MASLPCAGVTFGDDLVLREANDEACALLGYEASELVGQPMGKLLGRAGLIFFNTHVYPVLALHGRADELYLRLESRSGEAIPVLLNGHREVLDGATLYTCAFFAMRRRQLFEQELIAARNEAEAAARAEREAKEQIRVVQAQLAVRERLVSLGTLAAGIGHEINNPLMHVLTSLELLQRELASNDGAAKQSLLEDAVEGARRIRTIVQQMEQLTRGEDVHDAPVDLRDVASMAVRITRAQFARTTRVLLEAGDVPLVAGESGRVGQVLVNLIVNAAQAFTRGSPNNLIRVVARKDAEGSVVLEVIDNGPGIPEELQARIFEPFFTTKPVGEGSGLGLAISQSLIAHLGGSLTVESAAGKGATFRIVLPGAAEPQAKADGAPTPSSAPVAPGARRILVVDDDVAVARLVARVLRIYDVVVTHSADEALAKLADDARFDLVLCDVSMPRKSGLALHAEIEAAHPELAPRMVFMTGALEDRTREFLAAKGNEHLTKPLGVAELLGFCERRFAG